MVNHMTDPRQQLEDIAATTSLFSMATRADVKYPQLFTALRAVLDRHVPEDRGTGPKCKGCATHVTFTDWPCATVLDVAAALEES
jgi:hypothetical protein